MANYARILQIPLCLCGVFLLVYGIGFLGAPGFVWELSGEPLIGEVGLFRWLGAWLVAAGVACLSTGGNPQRQIPVLNLTAVGCGLAFMALVFNWVVGEYRGESWFIAVPLVLLGTFAPIFWWGQSMLAGLADEDERRGHGLVVPRHGPRRIGR